MRYFSLSLMVALAALCSASCQGNANIDKPEADKSLANTTQESPNSTVTGTSEAQPTSPVRKSESVASPDAAISCQPMHFATSTTTTIPWIRVSTGKSPVSPDLKVAMEQLKASAKVAKWPGGEIIATSANLVETKPANADEENNAISVHVKPTAALSNSWHRLSFAGPVPTGFRLLGNCKVFEDGSFGALFHPEYKPVAQRVRVCEKAAGGSRKVTLHVSERVTLAGNTAVGSLKVSVAGKEQVCSNLSLLSDVPNKDGSTPTTDEVSLMCPAWPEGDVVTVTVPNQISSAAGGSVTAPPGVGALVASGNLAQLKQVDQGCWDLPFSP